MQLFCRKGQKVHNLDMANLDSGQTPPCHQNSHQWGAKQTQSFSTVPSGSYNGFHQTHGVSNTALCSTLLQVSSEISDSRVAGQKGFQGNPFPHVFSSESACIPGLHSPSSHLHDLLCPSLHLLLRLSSSCFPVVRTLVIIVNSGPSPHFKVPHLNCKAPLLCKEMDSQNPETRM